MSENQALATGHEANAANFADTGVQIYSSIKGTDPETRKKIYTAVSASDSLRDFLNKKLNIVDVIAQNVQLTDDKTGEVSSAVRIVLIDDKGKAYGSVSTGVYQSLTNLFAIVGKPEEWLTPMVITPVEKMGRRGFRFISLELS